MNRAAFPTVFLVILLQTIGCAAVHVGGNATDVPKSAAQTGIQTTGTGLRGSLLLVGGGLDAGDRVVYERFVDLARAAARDVRPRFVIFTAASGNQEEAARRQVDALRVYGSDAFIDVALRETSTLQTVALVDAAHALFFTGGDQKRITDRYLVGGRDTPEATAMRRLLRRGGVIAGNSAGDAMMSDPMFLSGRSAAALGIRTVLASRPIVTVSQPAASATVAENDERPERTDPPFGPQIGKGMGFLPWAIADSHFFERDRFGRLVAALEASGKRLGVGVDAGACVEIDLATGEAIGVSAAESLLVDVGGLQRTGLTRRNIRTQLIEQGMRISLVDPSRALSTPPMPPQIVELARADSGARRSASRRFFADAQRSTDTATRLRLDGYDLIGWSSGEGAVIDVQVD